MNDAQRNYLLGVVAGDGGFSGKELRWTSTDGDWVEEVLRCDIGEYKRSGYQVENRKYCHLVRFGEKELVKWMVERGIKERKSENDYLVTPEEGYEWEFVRGFMDSDGSVCSGLRKTGYFYGNIQIYMRRNQMNWFIDFFRKELICYRVQNADCSLTVHFGLLVIVVDNRWSVGRFYDKVYRTGPWLERKKLIMEGIIKEKGREWTPKEMVKLLEFNSDFKERLLRDIASMRGIKFCEKWGLSYELFRSLKNKLEKVLGLEHKRGLRGSVRNYLNEQGIENREVEAKKVGV